MKHTIGFLIVFALTACAASPSPTVTLESTQPVEQGRILFRDKGCVTCHINQRVVGADIAIYPEFNAPNLTDYTNDPEFLKRWLTDPPAERPGTAMPNLHLSESEIKDLIAFLNEQR